MWIEFLVLIENHPDIGSRGSLKDATSRMDESPSFSIFSSTVFQKEECGGQYVKEAKQSNSALVCSTDLLLRKHFWIDISALSLCDGTLVND